jgi:tRNA (guanine37-N1)-methyltransferase
MRFDILSVFPEMIRPALTESILGRACSKGILEINLHNIRDYTTDKHRRTDDTPYGGGWGMVMTCQPIIDCHKAVVGEDKDLLTVYMSPSGKVLNQKLAMKLAKQKRIVIICGHYEGIDQRIIDSIVDEEISIGDYVLTGGEMPAAILVDCVSRLIPGVLPDEECHEDESIESGLLEYPQYTKPSEYAGMKVPEVLLSGNHANINKWRRQKSIEKTFKVRRDLIRKKRFSEEEKKYIESLKEIQKTKIE